MRSNQRFDFSFDLNIPSSAEPHSRAMYLPLQSSIEYQIISCFTEDKGLINSIIYDYYQRLLKN